MEEPTSLYENEDNTKFGITLHLIIHPMVGSFIDHGHLLYLCDNSHV